MASIVLSSVGNSLGNMILPGLGGKLFSSVGRRLGHWVDQETGWSSSSQPKDGARLENFKVQDSRYGLAIPQTFGCIRLAGNVIWASSLIETAHKESASGGKGGVDNWLNGGTRTTYSYSQHCAVALGAGPIGGVQTIWADSKVIYQNGVWLNHVVGSWSLHLGEDGQEPDPLLESWLGHGNVPAYQGIAYIVFESLQLGSFGNRLPNLTFEVIPANAAGDPHWLGDCAFSMTSDNQSYRNNGMRPIVVERSALRMRRLLTGGFELNADCARFILSEIDVAADSPVEIGRYEGPFFPLTTPCGQSWALAPDKRFIAISLQDGNAAKTFTLQLYDTATQSFGSVLQVSFASIENKQIAWIDEQRFVVTDLYADRRGVRVFMRAGLSICDLGFRDVWGSFTSASRYPLGLSHFLETDTGLLCLAGNASSTFTTLYACPISWANNKFSAGAPCVISTGYNLGTGNGPQFFVMPSGEQEWTAVYATTVDVRVMSFCWNEGGASVIRPWQTLQNGDLGTATCHAPALCGNKLVLIQRSMYETSYRVSVVRLDEGGFTFVKDAAPVTGYEAASADFCALHVGGQRHFVIGLTYNGTVTQGGLLQEAYDGDSLDRVVARILDRSGYASEDYDVSALIGVPVDGFSLTDHMTGAEALQILQALEPFDLVESSGMLVAVRRGQAQPRELDDSDLGALSSADKTEEGISGMQVTRVQELELPLELTVDTFDATRDYEIGSQRARRLFDLGDQRMAKIALPLVCSATRAKRVAERLLYSMWAERTRYRFSLSSAWLDVEPGDVLLHRGRAMRVLETSQRDGVLRVDAVSAQADGLTSEVYAESGAPTVEALSENVPTRLYLMDLPLLRPEDDQPGYYVAVSGRDGWSGASLWRSTDANSFIEKTVFVRAATAGTAVTALSEKKPYYKDVESVLRVQLYQGELSSCTEAQLLSGANAALCGGEIIQFQSATLVGPGLYELRTLLRGRQGTEGGLSTHCVGEDFVLLERSVFQFISCSLVERGQTYSMRAVSSGQSIGTAQDVAFTPQLLTLQPLAPTHISAVRAAGSGSDVTVTWKRRARKDAGWNDYVDVPLDEASELYDAEIIKNGVVLRLFEDLAAPTLIYEASQQTEDWPEGVPSQFTVQVYQKSARYGRGQVAIAFV